MVDRTEQAGQGKSRCEQVNESGAQIRAGKLGKLPDRSSQEPRADVFPWLRNVVSGANRSVKNQELRLSTTKYLKAFLSL